MRDRSEDPFHGWSELDATHPARDTGTNRPRPVSAGTRELARHQGAGHRRSGLTRSGPVEMFTGRPTGSESERA